MKSNSFDEIIEQLLIKTFSNYKHYGLKIYPDIPDAKIRDVLNRHQYLNKEKILAIIDLSLILINIDEYIVFCKSGFFRCSKESYQNNRATYGSLIINKPPEKDGGYALVAGGIHITTGSADSYKIVEVLAELRNKLLADQLKLRLNLLLLEF